MMQTHFEKDEKCEDRSPVYTKKQHILKMVNFGNGTLNLQILKTASCE